MIPNDASRRDRFPRVHFEQILEWTFLGTNWARPRLNLKSCNPAAAARLTLATRRPSPSLSRTVTVTDAALTLWPAATASAATVPVRPPGPGCRGTGPGSGPAGPPARLTELSLELPGQAAAARTPLGPGPSGILRRACESESVVVPGHRDRASAGTSPFH